MISSPVRRSRWRWLVLLLASPLIVWMLSAAFLRIVLVRDQSTVGWGDTIALVNGPEIDEVVALFKAMPSRRIVIFHKPPARPMQLGVLPEFHDHMRQELIKRGVPTDAIREGRNWLRSPARPEVKPGTPEMVAEPSWEPMPGNQMIIVADRLSSGRVWRMIRQRAHPPIVEIRVFARRLSGIDEFNGCLRPSGIVRVIRELSLWGLADPSIAALIEGISVCPE